MHSHSSHIITNIIAFCMQSVIDLVILPLHCLHLFQLFNVGVFALLKHALNKKINILN